jgi:hypothetical protein
MTKADLRKKIAKNFINTIYALGWISIFIGFAIMLFSDSITLATTIILCGLYFHALRFFMLATFGFPYRVEPDWTLVYPELVGFKKNAPRRRNCKAIIPLKYLFEKLTFHRIKFNPTLFGVKFLYFSYLLFIIGAIIFIYNGATNTCLTFLKSAGLLFMISLLAQELKNDELEWSLVYPGLDPQNKICQLNANSIQNDEAPTLQEWNDYVISLKTQFNDSEQMFLKIKRAKKKKSV